MQELETYRGRVTGVHMDRQLRKAAPFRDAMREAIARPVTAAAMV